uniref:RRM domain-containing protein n=1 Tax=Rhizophora mucronata TaxID=61149 RepID=A0A2P2LNH9_RHIMU
MKGKDSSEAKGYAFVSFRTKELASKAIKELNNTEFKVSHTLLLSFPKIIQAMKII